VSDPTGTLATPLAPVPRPGTKRGLRAVAALAAELEVERVIVGLPLSLSGRESAQTAETREWAARLARAVRVPVELEDERFTTALAQQVGGTGSEDSRAAAILLEGWLARRSSSAAPRTT